MCYFVRKEMTHKSSETAFARFTTLPTMLHLPEYRSAFFTNSMLFRLKLFLYCFRCYVTLVLLKFRDNYELGKRKHTTKKTNSTQVELGIDSRPVAIFRQHPLQLQFKLRLHITLSLSIQLRAFEGITCTSF
jgi:hypothetical protein